ncbi:hypothetical protein [Paraburkholderia dilworthii]|uniref:hypothetical protein n=1 Tax=Paraburkholderia dilworthii TaxID=948106 RepID=UPI001267F472|nr:hypothetical protein [Paraburkholderia dilworthii]
MTSSKTTFLVLCVLIAASRANACTVSENMEDSLPLNSAEVPNSDRVRITELVIAARQWPNVEIRGILYTGGYVLERDPVAIAKLRGSALRAYLIRLGIKESNIWMNTRTIKRPDIDSKGNKALNQIAVTLVPICEGGCERLCSDPQVTPTTRVMQ